MKRVLLTAGAVMVAGLGYVAPASAQATRTWVSGVGDDANPCSRTAPCKTFQGAIGKTAAGGQINCLDPAGYGTVTITKSLAILCDTTTASVFAAGTTGLIVNGANVVVELSGLDVDGLGNTGSGGTYGIRFLNGASLLLNNVKVRGFRQGYGVSFEPSTGTARLVIQNSTIADNGISTTGTTGGVLVKPQAGASATVAISDTAFLNNQNVGVRFETANSASTIAASVVDTSVVNNGVGLLFRALSGNGTLDATVNRTTIVQNNAYGFIGTGIGATVRVGDSTIANNAVGLLINGSAPVSSFGDNRLAGNGTNGAFPTLTAKQ